MTDPRELRRGDFRVHRSLPTRWSDDDTYGHVNNVVHYLMFDTAVNGWLIEASGTDIRRLPAIGVVVETSCRYFAELRFPEIVTAGIGLERLGTTSVVYRLALFGQSTVEPAAVGISTLGRPWMIGGYSYGGRLDQVFHGWIGDVRIVDRPLPVGRFMTA